jgi:putative ABC transport system permease protein
MLNDRYSEILHSLKQHKSRNILTGFGVGWGVFVLILLLGGGQGLKEGVFKLFSSFSKNSLWIYGGEVSEIDKEAVLGTKIEFNDFLLREIKQKFHDVDLISPEINHYENSIATFNNKNQNGRLTAIGTDFFDIKLLKLEKGRKFNDKDVQEKLPVCIIGSNIQKVLSPEKSLYGAWINISGRLFKVVGILKQNGLMNQGGQDNVYVTTASYFDHFMNNVSYNTFGMVLKNNSDAKKNEIAIKEFLANQLNFSPFDSKAIYVANVNEQVASFEKLFSGINIFLWMVGISILLSGIIGIGNIMLVTVKERTYEIGIRKALGAQSRSILLMVLSEAVAITLLAGVIGMILGGCVIGLANYLLASFYEKDNTLIDSFGIPYGVVIGAIVLLVLSGAIAGLIPAKKASEIVPVKALNKE